MESIQKKQSIKPFFTLLTSIKIPKWALIFGLATSLVTTIVGLLVPLLTRELVDGFSVEALSAGLIAALAAAFIVQAVINGVSIYLLSMVGQRIVAGLRERMWLHLLRLRVGYFDQHASGQTVSRVVNDTGIVRNLITDHFPNFVTG
ncbi:MAG: multidrug ABC transporter permease, partial [Planococcus sp. (in: firmicutes)]|nr:multidrug ABC transporter permease [Planococcus sp. (in: firmicutes)]